LSLPNITLKDLPPQLLPYILKRVEVGLCWEYPSASATGYAAVRLQGRTFSAHRAVWLSLVGPIPDGLVLDHLCRNTRCCNPDHLEPVTYAVNSQRGLAGWRNANKTHCKRNHPLSGDNLRMEGGKRRCRACHKIVTSRRTNDVAA
jgi:hypothetical protein